jgi:hypothetical protein
MEERSQGRRNAIWLATHRRYDANPVDNARTKRRDLLLQYVSFLPNAAELRDARHHETNVDGPVL